MRTLYAFYSLLVLLISGSAAAQNTSPYWSLAGNSTATATSKLGTTNNIPLRLFTNNVEQFRIDGTGKVGIGTTVPKGKLSIQSNGGMPAGSWVSSGVPIFAGFGENTPGNADHIMGMASNNASARAVFMGRKSRGTLASPTAVQYNDYILSLYSSAYDGSNFQAPATVDFFVDGSVTAGYVPTRISFSTGSSYTDRTERLKVGSNGDINFNSGQLFVRHANGYVGIGTSYPSYPLQVSSSGPFAVYAYSAGTGYTFYGQGSATTTDKINYCGYFSSNYVGAAGIGDSYGLYGASTNGWAGYFNGKVYTTSSYQTSDRKLKQHIQDAPSGLAILAQLKPRTYEFRQDGEFQAMGLPAGMHYGFIAQELDSVLPNLVKTASVPLSVPATPGQPNAVASNVKNGTQNIDFKTINYIELIPILVKGMQEQQAQIHRQDSTIAALQELVNKLSGGSVLDKGFLGQNTPNPATQSATIAYSVPPTVRQAHITVTDNMGRLQQDIRVWGKGTARINTSGLASGVYHYSLIADNMVVDTHELLIAR